jgi:small redox-active disulfide protein 2
MENPPVKTIEVLGPGCSNCHLVEEAAKRAVAATGVEATIAKVTDYAGIAAHHVIPTPGLVIDGTVVSAGRIPSADGIAGWLASA